MTLRMGIKYNTPEYSPLFYGNMVGGPGGPIFYADLCCLGSLFRDDSIVEHDFIYDLQEAWGIQSMS